jgi:hypothetical protein
MIIRPKRIVEFICFGWLTSWLRSLRDFAAVAGSCGLSTPSARDGAGTRCITMEVNEAKIAWFQARLSHLGNSPRKLLAGH